MWDLIVLIPDHCLSIYFVFCEKKTDSWTHPVGMCGAVIIEQPMVYFLVREHQAIQMAAIIQFDIDVSKLTRQGGCCTAVVVRSEILIHQQKGRKPSLYM